MTSHSKTYRQVSVQTTENRSLGVCHAFKINKNVIRMAGVIRSENIQPFEQLQLSFEKCLSVRTAAVLNSEFGKIQPFKQKSFSVRQRESDQNALDLPNCHTFVTEQWQHLSLLASVYFKDIALQMWRRLSFLSLSLHTNRRTRCETKLFAWLPSCS